MIRPDKPFADPGDRIPRTFFPDIPVHGDRHDHVPRETDREAVVSYRTDIPAGTTAAAGKQKHAAQPQNTKEARPAYSTQDAATISPV
jgi:hypothetical protein